MQTTRSSYWVTPVMSVLIGTVYLVAFSIGGHPGGGVFGLAVMVALGVGLVVAGPRSETVRGLLDRRDERITGIDLRATAFTGLVMIVAVLTGFVVAIARGHSGAPYNWIGAVGGVAYLGAVVHARLRG